MTCHRTWLPIEKQKQQHTSTHVHLRLGLWMLWVRLSTGAERLGWWGEGLRSFRRDWCPACLLGAGSRIEAWTCLYARYCGLDCRSSGKMRVVDCLLVGICWCYMVIPVHYNIWCYYIVALYYILVMVGDDWTVGVRLSNPPLILTPVHKIIRSVYDLYFIARMPPASQETLVSASLGISSRPLLTA